MLEIIALVLIFTVGVNYVSLTPEKIERMNARKKNPKRHLDVNKIGKYKIIGVITIIGCLIWAGWIAYNAYVLVNMLT